MTPLTGRFLVLLPHDRREAGVRAVESATGVELARVTGARGAPTIGAEVSSAKGVVLEQLGVAVVETTSERLRPLSVSADPAQGADVLAIEPERVVRALEDPARPEAGRVVPEAALAPNPFDESRVTWGLQVTGAAESRRSGRGIKLAILDTGLDTAHPDFAGRTIVAESFVSGETIRDVVGHGTHCTGTACGPREPDVLPRYGIAFEAEIHAGKVLDDNGQGGDGDILAGIAWALAAGCAVVSMSLGAPVEAGQAFSAVFERAAARALAAGTLIVAAAGNDSRRDLGRTAPVSHPANCPSIMAIAALDPSLEVSSFSNAGTAAAGGQVDLAAPGRDVRSSWPSPQRYNTISGTSMATPHVAGIAALAAEADRGARGAALWSALQRDAQRLPLPASDVGAGLVQAPDAGDAT